MSDAASAGLDDILARLRRLEDEREIIRLTRAFCVAADVGGNEEWLALFTEDGVLDTHGPRDMVERFLPRGGERTATGVRFAGMAALKRFIAGRDASGRLETRHHTTAPLIELDGDRARSSCYFLVTNHDGRTLTVFAAGRYDDQLVRCADGRWRVTVREIHAGLPETTSADAWAAPQ
jgi:hypothetical protein